MKPIMNIWKSHPQRNLFFVHFAVMLTFSTPLIAFAQEPTILSDVLIAKADAERDADAAVKSYLWCNAYLYWEIINSVGF